MCECAQPANLDTPAHLLNAGDGGFLDTLRTAVLERGMQVSVWQVTGVGVKLLVNVYLFTGWTAIVQAKTWVNGSGKRG